MTETKHWPDCAVNNEPAMPAGDCEGEGYTPELTYSEMVKVLAKDGETILTKLTLDNTHLWHMATGISGEAGELIDAIKKVAIYNKPIDRKNIIEELGDIEFYMEGLRQGLNITREETINANMQKLAKRYKGYSYSDEAAQERADKE